MNLDSREQSLAFELVAALGSSLELAEVLPRAQGVLSQLLSADYVALCLSSPGRPESYDWLVAEMPAAFFANYPELITQDFVRDAVLRHPNLVLRDTEMVTRDELERSLLYRHSRELDMSLEHVMAVLLDVKQDWHGGLTLYRERPRPFSDRERELLQWLAPFVARTIHNCRAFGQAAVGGRILDALFRQEAAFLVLAPPSSEKMRTPRATRLLEKWFTSSERVSGLPRELVERLAERARRRGLPRAGGDTVVLARRPDQVLKVTFIPLPEERGRAWWALLLEEVSRAIPLPEAWRAAPFKLSAREAEVVDYALRNWDNELIAEHLGLSLLTVKTHLRNSFRKLSVESRADLMYQAALLRGLP